MENLNNEKFEVMQMAYYFADAANRKDGELFESLWDRESAKWEIGPPINMTFEGRENMGNSVTHMLNRWAFFVQLVSGGVVEIRGDKAYARFYVHEVANSKEGGHGNNNLSMYEDELIKRDGLWYFTKRYYHTIHQSAEIQKGEVIGVPEIPDWLRTDIIKRRKS